MAVQVLFSASIEENIKFGRADASSEEVRQAALSANAGFVELLPEGFATQVGTRLDRSTSVIARALLLRAAPSKLWSVRRSEQHAEMSTAFKRLLPASCKEFQRSNSI